MTNQNLILASLKRRHRQEKIFRFFGLSSIYLALAALALLFFSVIREGHSAFSTHFLKLDITLSDTTTPSTRGAISTLLRESLQQKFPEVTARGDVRQLVNLLSIGAQDVVLEHLQQNPDAAGTTISLWLPVATSVDQYLKGRLSMEGERRSASFSLQQQAWVDILQEEQRIRSQFNSYFFNNADSREAELAGIKGAMYGSIMTLLIALLIAFPMGVLTAVYLEEFAPKNRFTEIIEININNLAAVPSIVFGLLGLALFLGLAGMGRSAPLVGGCVLGLMSLPTVIIATRAALKAVPDSLRQAAMGMGASPVQVVFHHVIPNAMPGILTGTIISMAQALGETAPLLMIGMVAFIADVPDSFTDSATVLPVQVYIWANSVELGFVERTSAAIIVLLGFLLLMNALAIYLRKRFEQKW